MRIAVLLALRAVATAPCSASTRTDATEPFFLEPTEFQNNETWSGVGRVDANLGAFQGWHGSGVLISPCHVLTAAHVLVGKDGIGNAEPDPRNFTFTLVTGRPKEKDRKLDESGMVEKKLNVAKIEFIRDGDMKYNMKLGHRINAPTADGDNLTRNDIAVLKLSERVPKKVGDTEVEIYAINQGEIAMENDPGLKTPAVAPAKLKGAGPGTTANAVKVGFGLGGNGENGAVGPMLKREMFNIINGFGDGKTNFADAPTTNRKNPPPKNTLVYDFDRPALDPRKPQNSSKLTNTFNDAVAPNYSVGQLEGSGAPGDSGGPMFQYKDGKKYVVGVTSSSSDTEARFGTITYDTQVQRYAAWIKRVVSKTSDFENPDCPAAQPPNEKSGASRGPTEDDLRDGSSYASVREPVTQQQRIVLGVVTLNQVPAGQETSARVVTDPDTYAGVPASR